MSKKVFSWMLMAALGVGFSLCLTSCKDHDKDDIEEQQPSQEEEADNAALAFWNVVSQLADIEGTGDDFTSQTFEPTIGTEAPGQPQTRIVATNSLEAAVASFNNLTGADITEDTQEYTWQNDAVGTLTWHKTGSTSLATIDVSIRQVPHLSQIMYMTPEQMGTNATYYCCYYRFGDVISRKRPTDGKTEYWVCVRPSFDPEGKDKSHWITLSTLPESNMDHYDKASNGIKYAVPKKLGLNKEHMQNLAEMLYAMNYGDDWTFNIQQYSDETFLGTPSGLPIFHDFHGSNISYNNKAFFQNVQKRWQQKKIYEKVFGLDANTVKNMLTNGGLHLLAEGYSWLWTFSNKLTLYEYTYTNGQKLESNMHKMTYRKVTQDVITNNIEINVNKMDSLRPYLQNERFFGDSGYRFIIRHATGEELGINQQGSTAPYDKRQALAGTGTYQSSPIIEVYRYYSDVVQRQSLLEEPEITVAGDDTKLMNCHTEGCGYYSIGDVVADQYGNRWFCILGSGHTETFSMITDRNARFISFDFKEVDTTGDYVPGLPTEEEIPELCFALELFADCMRTSIEGYIYTLPGPDRKVCKTMQNILDYAEVDLEKKWIWVDSTYSFNSGGKRYDSRSSSMIFNIAYDDGSRNKQAIARSILDNTSAGSRRSDCIAQSGKSYGDMFFCKYKHYETYDVSRIREPNDDEKSIDRTKYHLPWAMSNDKIYLQDIADADLVRRHAADDKWVTLPLYYDGVNPNPRRQLRSQAVNSVKPADCIGGMNANTLGMFNEPVIFIRQMKVLDEGGPSKMPNLVSTDGRKLQIVYMEDNAGLYKNHKQADWLINYNMNCYQSVLVDNKLVVLPYTAGWEPVQ